jgi:hypothetical protein
LVDFASGILLEAKSEEGVGNSRVTAV